MVVLVTTQQTERLLTGEELLAMGSFGPGELVEGRTVPMAPTEHPHGRCESNFDEHLKSFVKQHKLGQVLVGGVGIYTRRNPDTVRSADVIFISNERYAQLGKVSGFLDVAPELIVEIIAPGDRWVDVMQKLREYFAIGVRLVWLADLATRTVYGYRSLTDVRVFTEADTLPGDEVLPGFSIPVASLFEE